MRNKRFLMVTHSFLSILLILTFTTRRNDAAAHDDAHKTGGACRGFVVLSNGYAVLSDDSASSAHAPEHASQAAPRKGKAEMHKMGSEMPPKHESMMHKGHDHGGEMSKPSVNRKHLLGYRHGQEITLQNEMLCVPIGSKEAISWTTVSHTPALYIRAESLSDTLAHNSRANESLALTVMHRAQDASQEQPRIRLLVRMPHHDRHMPGGHGLANDPDVKGLKAQLDKDGRYRMQTLDFSMAGAWLLEVQVRQGGSIHRAYFAVDVDEE